MAKSPINVLLVEDNLEFAKRLESSLKALPGQPLRLAACGQLAEARKVLASSQTVDAVLLNLNLPDSQGLETLRQVREQAPGLPVVVVTASEDEALALEALRAGAQDYLFETEANARTVTRSVGYAIERGRGEQALRESEQRFKRLLQSTTDYIFSVTVANGRATSTCHGPGCFGVTGYSLEEFEADPYLWYRLIHEADRSRVTALVARILAGETVPQFEHRILHRDGSVRWIRNTSVLHKDAQGRLIGYDGLITDITERKRAERLLTFEHSVNRELTRTDTLPEVLARVFPVLCDGQPWELGAYWIADAQAGVLRFSGIGYDATGQMNQLLELDRSFTFAPGAGLLGRVWAQGEPSWIADLAKETDCPRAGFVGQLGLHGACAFPVAWGKERFGILELFCRRIIASDEPLMLALGGVGSQIGQFIDRRRSQEALAAERNLLRTLIDNLPDYVYVKDTESRFLINNLAHLCVLGAPLKQQVVGKSDLDFFPREQALQFLADDQAVLSSGQPLINHEEQVVDADGKPHWVLATKVPLRDHQGQVMGLVGISRDITGRKQAEDEKRLTETRLQAILDNSPAVIYLKDTRGRYLLINHRYEELFRIRREDIVGKTDYEVFPKEAADLFRANDQRVLQAQGPLKFEEVAPHDDVPHTYISVKFPLVDVAGKPYGVCGISTDITDRKQAEQALAESQERLELVIQGSNDGIWDWSIAANRVYYSPRWKSMLGYTDDEIENTFSSWEMLLHPEDRTRALAAVQSYFAGQSTAFELEHRLRHKDGTYRWILARGVALRDAEGRPLRMAGSHVDLTEHKQKEEQLRQAYEELSKNQERLRQTLDRLRGAHRELKSAQQQLIQAEKLKSIGKLAAGVAHEVKNPLQTILMGITFLNNNLAGKEATVTMVLSELRTAVERADSIIHELLQLSAATRITVKTVEFNTVVERALAMMHLMFDETHVQVVRELASGLPELQLDPSRMEQVFTNLFMNAIHAMPGGGVLTVRTRFRRWPKNPPSEAVPSPFKPGDLLVIAEVQDNGTGIAAEVLPMIFEPFFTTKPMGVGTGLGLAVIKNIIDLHGGTIEVTNVPEGGVCVTLALKVQQGTTFYEQEADFTRG